jgi:hypothetical protein
MKDKSKEVRIKMCSCFHECINLCPPEEVLKFFYPIFKDIIKENDDLIVDKII